MAVFDPSIYTNLTKVPSLLGVADTFTSGILGVLVYFLITLGALFINSERDFREGALVGTFLGMLSTIILNILGLMGSGVVIMSAILFIIAVLLAYFSGPRT